MTLSNLANEILKLPSAEQQRPAVAQTPDGKLHPVSEIKEVKNDVRLNPVAIILTGDA